MNVFINTSAKVKQNKLTKQSKRYDDGFHDSDNKYTERHTRCDAKKILYPCIFPHTVHWKSQPSRANRTNERTNERTSEPTEPTETENQQKNCYFSSFPMLLSLYVVFICVVCLLRTRSRLHVVVSCTRSSLESQPTPNPSFLYICVRLAVAARHNKTIHMHQNDRFYYWNSSSFGWTTRRKEQTPKPIKNASCFICIWKSLSLTSMCLCVCLFFFVFSALRVGVPKC